MTPRYTLLLPVLLLLLPHRVVTAHHAFSPVYDGSKTVTIVGTLTDFKLVNPHAMMTVDVVDKTGKHVTWAVEMAGLLSLTRQGWTESTVSAGQLLTLTGNPTHTASPRIFLTQLVMPDGTVRKSPGAGDVDLVEEQRRERARQRQPQK